MFKRVVSLAAGAALMSGAAAADDRPYELVAAHLDGRFIMAIVNRHGTAVAVEIDEESNVIHGLAAGAILSDLRAAAVPASNVSLFTDGQAGNSGKTVQVASGAERSTVAVDGEVHVGRASLQEAADAIENLPKLTEAQRRELRSYLGL